MDTINQISTTDRTPLHTSFCCRSSTEDSSGKKTPGWSRETHGTHPGTHGTHGLGTDAHGSHRRTSQAHNHPATHECRDATELGVAARDGVEASGSRLDLSEISRPCSTAGTVQYSTCTGTVCPVSPRCLFTGAGTVYFTGTVYPPGVFLPAPPGVFLRFSIGCPGSPRCLFTGVFEPGTGTELLHVAPLDEIHVQQHHSVGWRSYGGGARD